ncbi:MAG: hypothetical protein ACK4N5_10560, partial [Myxococcales bacterium]
MVRFLSAARAPLLVRPQGLSLLDSATAGTTHAARIPPASGRGRCGSRSHPGHVRQLALTEPCGLYGRSFSATIADIIHVDLFDRGINEMFWQNEVL